MIERVARAMCREAEERTAADTIAKFGDEGWKIIGFPTLDAWVDASWVNYVSNARAALAAMREPTEAMREAGGDRLLPPDMRGEVSPHVMTATEVWGSMIDAALAESAPSP